MFDKDPSALLDLTATIVAAFVSRNVISASELPATISATHAALAALGAPPHEPEIAKPIPKISERKSIKPEGLISMIDGRPYKMLKRHLANHGHTPQSYREAFGLSPTYPMTHPAYSEQRRQLALSIGLGHQRAKH
jgi:predicted transcriptional regulator